MDDSGIHANAYMCTEFSILVQMLKLFCTEHTPEYRLDQQPSFQWDAQPACEQTARGSSQDLKLFQKEKGGRENHLYLEN